MNLKKVFVALILLVMCVCLLSGCNSTTSTVSDEKNAEPTVETFVLITSKNVFRDIFQYIMYDPETMVMYTALETDDIGAGVSLSPMYNSDGTIRLYNPTDK